MHFLGFKWDNTTAEVVFQFRDSFRSSSIQYRPIQIGSDISLVVQDEIYCIGYFNYSTYARVVCGSRITSGRQCDTCRYVDSGTFLPLGALRPEQKDVLREKPHFNYLNLFGPDVVKVGVASAVRKKARVWEQGAHATLFFAQSDGVVAREIEEWVVKTFDHIKEKMMVPTKISLLYNYVETQKAEDTLRDTLSQIALQLPDEYRSYFIDSPEYMHNIDLYRIEDKESVVYSVKNVITTKLIVGKIVGTVGEVLVLEDVLGRVIALNSKLLIGRIIEISGNVSRDVIPEDQLKKVVFNLTSQTSLFD